jgi:hypothetical protein
MVQADNGASLLVTPEAQLSVSTILALSKVFPASAPAVSFAAPDIRKRALRNRGEGAGEPEALMS